MTLNEISSNTAFDILNSEKESFLIDVRTEYEWTKIGVPNLKEINKTVLFIQWSNIIDINFVENFLSVLKSKFHFNNKLLFICRSGSRSRLASEIAIRNNFKNCYNISDGFEGLKSNGMIDGWKPQNLPWTFMKS